MNYQAPIIRATIGSFETENIIKMRIKAACSAPCAFVELECSNLDGALSSVAKADKLLVQAGYRGEELISVFDGSVRQAHNYKTLKIEGYCRALALVDNAVSRTYHNEDASQIVKHLVEPFGFAGLDIFTLESLNLTPKAATIDRLPLCNTNVNTALNMLKNRLALPVEWYCTPDGVFHCVGRNYEQAAVMRIMRDDVLNSRVLPGGRLEIKIECAPSLWHSKVIELEEDDETFAPYFVEKVEHSIGFNDANLKTVLTLIYIGE